MNKTIKAIIYETTDYSEFQFIETNRDADSSARLKKSIEDIDMTPYVPVITTEIGHYIIDGQHRFEVCKELGMPICFVEVPPVIDKEKAMRALNTATVVWRQEEWFEYYYKSGVEPYDKLKSYIDKSPINLGISNYILIFSQASTNATMFKDGKLIDKSNLFEPIVNFLADAQLSDYRIRTYRPFVNALVLFFQDCYYTANRKISKLKNCIGALPKLHSCDDYVRWFKSHVK